MRFIEMKSVTPCPKDPKLRFSAPWGFLLLLFPHSPQLISPRSRGGRRGWCICCSPPLVPRPAPALNTSGPSRRCVTLQDRQPELSAFWEGGNIFALLNSNGSRTLSLLSSLLVQNIMFVKIDRELRKLLKTVGWKSPWKSHQTQILCTQKHF